MYIRAVSTGSAYRHLEVFFENMGTIGQYAHSFSSLQFPGRICPLYPVIYVVVSADGSL